MLGNLVVFAFGTNYNMIFEIVIPMFADLFKSMKNQCQQVGKDVRMLIHG